MTARRHPLAALLLSSLALACGGGSDHEIAESTLSGTVGGATWTFAAGETNAFLSAGEDNFFAELYAEDYEPCTFATPDGDFLIVAVPKEPGEYELDSDLNMTFVVGDADNLVSFDGLVRVDEVTATTVRGGLSAAFEDNEVSGTFELTVCPEDE
jgi:hypothetical protein